MSKQKIMNWNASLFKKTFHSESLLKENPPGFVISFFDVYI
jgi:hypothetical protein